MLKITDVYQESCEDYSASYYDVEGTVTLAMDSLQSKLDGWDNGGSSVVTVTDISVIELHDTGTKEIRVSHDSTWELYDDSGFAAAVSEVLGYEVFFTEQGMQEDGVASLEAFD